MLAVYVNAKIIKLSVKKLRFSLKNDFYNIFKVRMMMTGLYKYVIFACIKFI